MSTVAPQTLFPFSTSQDVAVTTWSPLAAGDSADPINLGVYSDRTVQVDGTFGGATVVLEGSLEPDPINYATLTDPQGNGLSFSAAKIEAVSEVVNHIRPRVIGGDGTTSLTCTLLLRRTTK